MKFVYYYLLGSVALLWRNAKRKVNPGLSNFERCSLSCTCLLANLHLHFAFRQSKQHSPYVKFQKSFSTWSSEIVSRIYLLQYHIFLEPRLSKAKLECKAWNSLKGSITYHFYSNPQPFDRFDMVCRSLYTCLKKIIPKISSKISINWQFLKIICMYLQMPQSPQQLQSPCLNSDIFKFWNQKLLPNRINLWAKSGNTWVNLIEVFQSARMLSFI